jgi:hypothetical protein
MESMKIKGSVAAIMLPSARVQDKKVSAESIIIHTTAPISEYLCWYRKGIPFLSRLMQKGSEESRHCNAPNKSCETIDNSVGLAWKSGINTKPNGSMIRLVTKKEIQLSPKLISEAKKVREKGC